MRFHFLTSSCYGLSSFTQAHGCYYLLATTEQNRHAPRSPGKTKLAVITLVWTHHLPVTGFKPKRPTCFQWEPTMLEPSDGAIGQASPTLCGSHWMSRNVIWPFCLHREAWGRASKAEAACGTVTHSLSGWEILFSSCWETLHCVLAVRVLALNKWFQDRKAKGWGKEGWDILKKQDQEDARSRLKRYREY